MARPLLTLDRGNSTLDAMLHPSGNRVRLAADDLAGLAGLLGDVRPEVCAAVSVVPDGLRGAMAWLTARGIPVAVAGTDLPCPLVLDYQTPATLGADRWVGALAAHRAYGDALVVDCGSATTLSLVDAAGTFRGGCIGPGLMAMQEAMRRATPFLPAADPAQAGPLPARSTTAAVAAGLLVGWCGLVERLAADVLASCGAEAVVVLTGGNAAQYLRFGRLPAVEVPDLIHRGLRLLLEPGACGC